MSPMMARKGWTSCIDGARSKMHHSRDWILLDLNLPKYDGRQVLQVLKSGSRPGAHPSGRADHLLGRRGHIARLPVACQRLCHQTRRFRPVHECGAPNRRVRTSSQASPGRPAKSSKNSRLSPVSAVASTTVVGRQRRQRLDLPVVDANAASRNKRPSRLRLIVTAHCRCQPNCPAAQLGRAPNGHAASPDGEDGHDAQPQLPTCTSAPRTAAPSRHPSGACQRPTRRSVHRRSIRRRGRRAYLAMASAS